MNLTLSNEKVMVNGKSIPKIYGGFGIGQPVILAKQVAEIHEYTVKQINQLVYKNSDWFDEGIDYLDLKSINSSTCPGVISNYPSAEPAISRVASEAISNDPLEFLVKSGLYPNSQAIGGAKYIYLFSQQGYAILCKLLKSDLAKQIYKQMVREYFRMLETQQNLENSKETLSKQKGNISEGYWFSGKLAEIILEGIQQNREEMNQIHLELRDLKEEMKALKNQRLAGNSASQVLNYEGSSSFKRSSPISTESFISKAQAQELQQIVKAKAQSKKQMIQIWFKFR